MSDALEPDRIEGAPHPRETLRLFGQEATEAAFMEAYSADRLHHGWLITGPRGTGKATLAWRIARFLLATPPAQDGGLFGEAMPKPQSLDVPAEHPVARRLLALSEPALHLVRRGGSGTTDSEREKNYEEGKFSQFIRVDRIRALSRFVHMSAADGGRRVVIVDAADEMNNEAANALLKMLEEPPAQTTLLLIAHQPARLLPTIRSRCRELRMAPLGPADIAAALAGAGLDPGPQPEALAELSAGSVGEAVRLLTSDGVALYAEIIGILGAAPQSGRARALKLADSVAARGAQAERRLDLLLHLGDVALSRLARTGSTGQTPAANAAPQEDEVLRRLSPTPQHGRAWADCAQLISARMRHGRSVNLDPAALVLDMVFRMQKTTGG